MEETQLQFLVEAALEVQARAYAPYSKFAVGAALQTSSGAVFIGCNVENASYGLANCAERVAVGSMIAGGEQNISAVVVASPGGARPCGACRQVLAEFGTDFPIHCLDSQQRELTSVWQMSELLPGRFTADDLS